MRGRFAVILVVCGFLAALIGVAQAQEVVAPSSDLQIPMEILMGLVSKYTTMAQQYQSIIAQGGEPETAIQFRLAAKVVMNDEVTDLELETMLTEFSEMAFWIEANIFGRYTSYFKFDLTGSLGNIELISTPDGVFVISRDEAVFARLDTGEDIANVMGLIPIAATLPEDFGDIEPDFFSSLDLLVAWFGRILTASASQLVMEYAGLESTSKGMAHIVRLIFTESGEIITLWVLDETWELCKMGIDDPDSGISTLALIEEIELVASLPESTFAFDIAGLAELSQEDFLALADMKILTVGLIGPPVAADISLSLGEIPLGEQVVVRSDGLDAEDEESDLIPQVEYRLSNGSWTPLTASYVGVAPLGHWESVLAPSVNGVYDFRVAYTDSDGGISDPLELLAALNVIEVIEVAPQVVDVSPVDQAEDVSVSSQIIVTFSQEMDTASVESAFMLTDAEGQAVSGKFEWTDNTLSFTPDQGMTHGQSYSAKINASASGINAVALGEDVEWSFATEKPVEVAPQVVDVSPADQAEGVSVSPQIIVTFSQEMDTASVESAFMLTDAGGQAVSGTFEWTDNTLIFTPDQGMTYGQSYSVKINAAALGINAVALGEDFGWSFITEHAPAPRVVVINPEDTSRNVPISIQVSATFTEAMDQASVEDAFSFTVDDQVVSGLFQWDGGKMVFIPEQDLRYNSTYRVRIAGSASSELGAGLDANGNGISEGTPGDDLVWEFRTEVFPTFAVKPASKTILGGDFVTVEVVAEAVSRLVGFTLTVDFDPAVLSLLKVERRSFVNWRPRPKDIEDVDLWQPTVIDDEQGLIVLAIDSTRAGGISGAGILATLMFQAVGVGESPIQLKDVAAVNAAGEEMALGLNDGSIQVQEYSPWDTNQDGVVDILDFITIQAGRGASPDVNGDGVVDIRDMVAVAGGAQASPVSVPDVSELYDNYPNPFNPETWIPYQLAGDANVVIRIYSATGRLVRTLDMGYETAGRYVSRASAAYWDGANEAGERVASGVYYYNITAGAFSAVKKMVISE